MKLDNFTIIGIIIVAFSSCNSNNKPAAKEQAKTAIQESPKNFFDYDRIDHYYYNFDVNKTKELYDNQKKSYMDALTYYLISDEIVPIDISDTFFIDRLEQIGYSKNKIATKQFPAFNAVFSEKKSSEPATMAACIPIYRDILIFRKQNKVAGMVKICFECGMFVMRGAKFSTDNFGQHSELPTLEALLHGK